MPHPTLPFVRFLDDPTADHRVLEGREVIGLALAPDWWLVRDRTPDGTWSWGLVDGPHAGLAAPSCSWLVEPTPDPLLNVSDEEIERIDDETDGEIIVASIEWLTEVGRSFVPHLRLDPMTGHRLVEAAKASGYDPEVDGFLFEAWLMSRVAVVAAEGRMRGTAVGPYPAHSLAVVMEGPNGEPVRYHPAPRDPAPAPSASTPRPRSRRLT